MVILSVIQTPISWPATFISLASTAPLSLSIVAIKTVSA